MLASRVFLTAKPLPKPVSPIAYKYVKQSGGHGQYGHVVFAMEPLERGAGVQFENKITGGSIPKEYIPAVEKGVKEAVESGVFAGYPVTDMKVQLIDGSYHEVDSSEMAFKMAAIMGFREGLHKGGIGIAGTDYESGSGCSRRIPR